MICRSEQEILFPAETRAHYGPVLSLDFHLGLLFLHQN
jgi:hypothetical protein